MTTATLARGPPLSIPCPQEVDDDEDALMDEEEDCGSQSPGQEEEESRMRGLMIDEADPDMNSDDGADYSTGDIVDYSGTGHGHSYPRHRKSAPSSGSLSDGEADSQDNGNGSIQSFDEYQHGDETGEKKGGSGYGSGGGGGKMNSMSLLAKSGNAKNGKNFICDICMKTFSNAANMRRHRVRHSGIKPFECRFCQKRFFRKDHMREHMNHKHNNTQMECYFCQQVFDKEKDLFQHVTRDHDVNPRELHCQYCSFSATTIGRYLWHMTTSHPRKNSHYTDGTGEPLSMAPYPIDDYESPQASPKISPTTVRDMVGSSSPAGRAAIAATRSDVSSGGYDLSSALSKASTVGQRNRERRQSASPPQTATSALIQSNDHHSSKFRHSASSNRLYGSLDVDDSAYATPLPSSVKSSAAAADSVRYVSILPNKFLPPDTSSSVGLHGSADDLTSSYGAGMPEDLSHAFVSDANVKSAFAMLQRKMNGNSAIVAAAFAAAAQAQADSTGRNGGVPGGLGGLGGGSNRRKSKAPVRMTTTPEDGQNATNGLLASSSVVSSSKRDRDVLNEGTRNGNEVSGGRQHFSPILEEVMSMQQRVHHNNYPEDLSSSGNGMTNSRLPSTVLQRLKAPAPSSTTPPQNGVTDHTGLDTLSKASNDQESEQKCPHCLIIYPDNVLYMLHKMLHTKDHPYRCAQCLTQFPNRYEFYAHIVNHGSASSSGQ